MTEILEGRRGAGTRGTLSGGRLVLVVGPSGVGVDTLIDAARAVLSGDPRYHFVRRTISRPAGSVGEAHDPIDLHSFRARRAAGDFALSWEAHGMGYGIPMSIEHHLRDGRTVIVNASRTVIEEARGRYPNLTVASVTASPETLAARLAGRKRESAEEIERRLKRAELAFPHGDDVVSIDNNGSLESSIEAFIGLLRATPPVA